MCSVRVNTMVTTRAFERDARVSVRAHGGKTRGSGRSIDRAVSVTKKISVVVLFWLWASVVIVHIRQRYNVANVGHSAIRI